MKKYYLNGFLIVGFALTAVSAVAQKDKSTNSDKDRQTIIINREDDGKEKTVIEITGDKVLINGKDASDIKDVRVNLHRFKDGGRGLTVTTDGRETWNAAFGSNNSISLLSEDSNRAMLGVVTDADARGAEITSVSKASAAEKAGLKKGDIITRIGDSKVSDADDVSKVVRAHKPGDKVAISVLRGGKEEKITAELGRWKGVKMNSLIAPQAFENFSPRIEFKAPSGVTSPGRSLSLDFNRPRLGLSLQDTDNGKGLKVIGVNDDGIADKAGIKEDDIITHLNDVALSSTEEIVKLVRENKENAPMKMQIIRGGKTQTIEVRIPKKLKTTNL